MARRRRYYGTCRPVNRTGASGLSSTAVLAMPSNVLLDEDLVRRLPLPLAQLYRRAHNAKSAVDRHNAAYYLWEAALKLLGSVAVVEYAELGDVDPQLVEMLENLARPAVGHWWQFVRRLV